MSFTTSKTFQEAVKQMSSFKRFQKAYDRHVGLLPEHIECVTCGGSCGKCVFDTPVFADRIGELHSFVSSNEVSVKIH